MSRGLGTAQRLMLKALASLEAEHGGDSGLFFVWAIVDRAYELSPEMQARHQAMTDASAARSAEVQARAAAGDERAALFLALTRSLTRTRRAPRTRRTTPFWLTEGDFNPSRILASLQRRGLVTRRAIKGGGSAGLTDAGRAEASSLSVGSTCHEKVEHA